MLSDRIRSMAAPHWLALFGAILGAWALLLVMAVPADLRDAARIYGADFWAGLCVVTPDAAGFGKLVLMWALMAAAMMLPTALPAFATFDDLTRGDRRAFATLVAGFATIWLGGALIGAGAQMALFRAGLVSPIGDSLSVWLSAGLLVVAGLYQFSALKEACLNRCRAPFAFFMEHWQSGPLAMGLRLGAVCVGCCWALMALAFVGGVMNLWFMGLATLLMIFEKLPELGRPMTRPLGFGLIAAGAALAALG